MANWVGKSVWITAPLVEAIGDHIMAATALHGDDTPVSPDDTLILDFRRINPGLQNLGLNVILLLFKFTQPRKKETPSSLFFFFLFLFLFSSSKSTAQHVFKGQRKLKTPTNIF